jgi:5-methylcytosine-specific restriction endonuclease McrA
MKDGRVGFEDYRRLHRHILQRDGWRCQLCGSSEHLQVHHIVPRGHSGDDVEEDLITVCWRCHRRIHERGDIDR